MKQVVEIQLYHFLLIYLLMAVVIFIFKKCNIEQEKLIMWASIRMSLQLIIAGLLLTFLFKEPNDVLTYAYIAVMYLFTWYQIGTQNKGINVQFKKYIAISVGLSTGIILLFFIVFVIQEDIGNPQYSIPLSGMLFGNVMSGVNLGIKTFYELLRKSKLQLETQLNMGIHPKEIVKPFIHKALEHALLPTLNSMISIGIVSLPGMMTGQILSGTVPMTAILYQIGIMICICSVVCLSVFSSLYWGYHTLYTESLRFKYEEIEKE